MSKASIVAYIEQHAQEKPIAPAIIVGDTTTNYNDLWNKVRGFACYLKTNIRLQKGDTVAVKATQSLDYAISYFGTHLAGGIFVPVEHNIANDGFIRIIKETNPKLVIVNLNDNPPSLEEYTQIFNTSVCQIADEYYERQSEVTFDFPEGADSADILFTTGTTGVSKGVELSHRALVATAENLIFGCEMKKDTQILVPGPLNHANPIRKLYTAMVNGSSIIILNGMTNVRAFFNALDKATGTIACCLPPAAIRTIFVMTGDKLAEYSGRIDFIESASAPLPETDKLKLCELLPKTRLYNNYGSSEAASVCMYDYNRLPGKMHCIGKAMPNSRIIVVDDEKKEIYSSADHLGLLACIGDVNMKGYWNAPELTAEVLQNGTVYTNDIGYIDSEGFIYIIGRKGDVINVGGLKVAPTEVEEAALGYPAIEDCVCVPVDDNITGKAIKLCVVLKSDEALNARNIKSYLTEHLENYKVPKYVEAIDAVPRTYNGKIDRKELEKFSKV